MAIIKCKMCGGDLELLEDSSVCECEYCGTKQTVPKVDDEKKLKLFERANRLRTACEFDKAAGVYETIIADFDQEAEAYWGLILCKFGIEYVDDPATGKKIPTCHRSSFESLMDDPNFEMVMECADPIARRVYRDEAKQIEELRKSIIEVSSREEPYDVFISYKELAEDGQRTLDSVIAQDIYTELTDKGYRVFFSRISLEDKLGVEYEPYIFAALNSAKVMLVVGTDYDYFNAVWVKNEWSRFLALMAKGEKKVLIPVFKGIDAYDMPKEFSKLAAQDMGKVGAMQDLIRGVEKILGKKKPEPTMNAGPRPGNAFTERGMIFVEDEDFDRAEEYFEKALDQDPKDSRAYFGKVLCFLHRAPEAEKETLLEDPESSKDYSRAMRYADGQAQREFRTALEQLQKKHWITRFAIGVDQIRARAEAEEKRIEKWWTAFPDLFTVRNGVLEPKPERKGIYSISTAIIPDEVKSIGDEAFYGFTNLTSVTIPEGVTSIGAEAFSSCKRLTSVTIPERVTSIGREAFSGCSGLKKVIIHDLDAWCRIEFYEEDESNPLACGGELYLDDELIRDLVIPEGVTSIGAEAFSGCASLLSVTIPESVTSIGDWAFENCKSLTSVTIPESVTSIGFGAFSGCVSLPSVTLRSGVTSIGDSAFRDCKSLTSVTIPDSVTSIGDSAFRDCKSLTSVTIPDSVKNIGDSAFENCASLTSVTIRSDMTSIGDSAFRDCKLLADADGFIIVRNVLYSYHGSGGNVTIPLGVTRIGGSAFYNCESLTSVTIPESVTSIGNSAFYNCMNLASVTIPDSVTSIGNSAFYDCKSLTSVTIPDSVTSIGEAAFIFCSALTSVVIPKGVTVLEKGLFDFCGSLQEVTIPEGVSTIGEEAFYNCTRLKNLALPESVTSIAEDAFATYNNPYMNATLKSPVIDVTLHAVRGGYVEQYAREHGLAFHAIKSRAELAAEKAAAERAEAERRAAAERAEAARKAAAEKAEAERKAKVDSLNREKAQLQAELPTIKGLFSGGKRRQIEARLAEIEAELKTLG